jgi:hypothetical protein
LGAAAFWIALAAVLISGGWNKFRREQLKQQTLLRLVERTGQLDEAQVKLLFPPLPQHSAPPHERPWWAAPPDPLAGQRALRGGGVVVVALAAGIALLSLALRHGTEGQQAVAMPWLGVSGLLVCLGIGMLVAARFATGPVQRDERK